MKIVYCINGVHNSGGTERVLANKANYLVEKYNYEVIIITTGQKERSSFFKFDPSIKFYDLDINYDDDDGKSVLQKAFSFFIRKRKHFKALESLLFKLKPDITISMFGNEAMFLCDIKDGSKKVLEIHFSKFFRVQLKRSGVWRIVDCLRSKQDEKVVRKFDRFVVLTEEDRTFWRKTDNIEIIPNSIFLLKVPEADLAKKEVLAVGRYSFQKGFDLLIDAWKIVNNIEPSWKLKIVGDGELRSDLENKVELLELTKCIELKQPTAEIEKEYLNSSIYVLSSRYEGLPMVLLEAMSYRMPIVAFECKCGPKDLITNGVEGLLVKENNIQLLAKNLLELMNSEAKRMKMGQKASEKVKQYAPEIVMEKWRRLFFDLTNS